MNNDKFVGFFIMGTKNQQEAEQGKGLILWTQSKPSWIRKWINEKILNIRWVDKEDYSPIKVEDSTTKVEMPKQRSYKKTDGPVKERRNSKSSSNSSRE